MVNSWWYRGWAARFLQPSSGWFAWSWYIVRSDTSQRQLYSIRQQSGLRRYCRPTARDIQQGVLVTYCKVCELLQGVLVTARCVSYCSYQLHFCEQPDVTLTDLWFQLASSSCGWPSYLIDVRMWQVLFNQPGCCCTFFTAAALGSFLTILQAGSDCSREPLEIILVGLSAGHVPPLLI